MFVVSLSFAGSISGRRKARVRPFETITIKTRRESTTNTDLAATCKAILIPISDFSCSRFSEFMPQAESVIVSSDGMCSPLIELAIWDGLPSRTKDPPVVSLAGGFC